jgi:hypothetical protein
MKTHQSEALKEIQKSYLEACLSGDTKKAEELSDIISPPCDKPCRFEYEGKKYVMTSLSPSHILNPQKKSNEAKSYNNQDQYSHLKSPKVYTMLDRAKEFLSKYFSK